MFTCPNCQTELKRIKSKFGMFWYCPSCKGRAATLELLRKIISGNSTSKLWQRTISGQYPQKRKCPSCASPMAEVPIINGEYTVYLDTCKRCRMVWFDNNEYQQLPKIKPEAKITDKLTMEQREKLALARLEFEKEKQRAADIGYSSDEAPDNYVQVLLGFVGFPIEYDDERIKNTPFVTWTLTAVIAIVSFFAFYNLRETINNWGLIPEYYYRHSGLTLISSFFLHANIFHLVSNLYFLIIFGDNVEDFLGRFKYIVLIILAALVGDITHILSDPHSLTPCIGASGGISGVITYYALRFPHNQIGMMCGYRFLFRWIRMPAICLFALWILMQTVGAIAQFHGFSNVSALAHLGGVATGFVFWLYTRPKNKASEHSEAL
ncbi:MAG: rhomboid family intramembrane serine protease [Planctomycetaceae bacterium]|nr:rhomboid family intramembrane serine protease [Planctomycetaceae bacterium]